MMHSRRHICYLYNFFPTFILARRRMSRDARIQFLDQMEEFQRRLTELNRQVEDATIGSQEHALRMITAVRNRLPPPVAAKYNRMDWPLDVVRHARDLLKWCNEPKIRRELGTSFFAPSNFWPCGAENCSSDEEISPKWLSQSGAWSDTE